MQYACLTPSAADSGVRFMGLNMNTFPHSLAREALRSNVLFRRAQKRFSQATLAERSGVSRTIISSVENCEGNVTLENIEKIAQALETNVADLFAEHVNLEASEADLARRAKDGPEAYVDADDFLAALDERTRYSKRGRRKAVSSSVAS
jgi:transcriptional regulator with XRE-family HTH domain